MLAGLAGLAGRRPKAAASALAELVNRRGLERCQPALSWAVTHFRVNGYANGWRIPWTGSYELVISYGPERLAQAARRLDLVAIPLGVLALFLAPIRRRHKNRQGSRSGARPSLPGRTRSCARRRASAAMIYIGARRRLRRPDK